MRTLRNDDTDARNKIAKAFNSNGYDTGNYLELLAALLWSEDDKISGKAAYSLGELGAKASFAAPDLIRALGDSHPGVRWNAATALGKIGGDASAALYILQKVIEKDDSHRVRQAAEEALSRIKPLATDPVPTFIEMLRSDDKKLRGWAVRALGEIGADAKDAVPVLSEMLDDYLLNAWLRVDIANTLAAIGPDAADALPALSVLLLDWDYSTVEVGIHALKAIGGDPVPYIVEYLAEGDPYLALLVIKSAALIGRWNEDAFPLFVDAMKDNDFGLRMGADAILDGTYPDLSYAITVYKEVLKDNSPIARQFAVFLIGAHSPEPSDAFPIVMEVLSDENPFVRATAILTLGYMGRGAKEAIPYLIEMLDDEEEIIASSAVSALGLMGEAAIDILPKLREMHKNADQGEPYYLRTQLELAIMRIETGRIGRYR